MDELNRELEAMQEEEQGARPTTEEIEMRLRNLRRNSTTGLRDTEDVPDNIGNPLSEEDQAREIQRVKAFIKSRYPQAKLEKLMIRFSKNPKRSLDIVVVGPREGEVKILLDNGSGFTAKFLNLQYAKNALDIPA